MSNRGGRSVPFPSTIVHNRDRVLDAVRRATRHPSSAHEGADGARCAYPEEKDPRSRPWRDPRELCAEFIAEFERLGRYEDQQFGAAWVVSSLDEAAERLNALFHREDVHRVCAARGELTELVLPRTSREDIKLTWALGPGRAGHALAECDLGITDCACLVAHTGSVLVTTAGGRSRAASLLPPIHVVLASVDQLVPDVPDAIDRLVAVHETQGMPSTYTFITGASRTADIEKVLVIPAHGPRELYAILMDDATS